VSIDIYLNATTRHAHVLLPSPSALAKPHLDLAFYGLSVRNVVNYSPPLHPADDPSEPGMDEHDLFAKLALIAGGMGADADPSVLTSIMQSTLADRAGLDLDAEVEATKHLTPVEAMLDLMLRTGPYDLDLQQLLDSPHGVDLGPLEPRLPGILRTVSGKVEVAAPPIIDDVPRLASVLDAAPDERLLLVGRRHLRSNNSWMHNIEVLVKGKPRCTLQLHPDDAAARGVEPGHRVVVRSDTGQVEATVEVTDEIAAGTVSLPHGWGHDAPGTRGQVAARTEGVNSNVLTGDQAIDPLSGNARLNAIPVEVLALDTVGA
jgi:anaerobic selenocysteine-containing dehydrogenase